MAGFQTKPFLIHDDYMTPKSPLYSLKSYLNLFKYTQKGYGKKVVEDAPHL